jgi:hypothetical protein
VTATTSSIVPAEPLGVVDVEAVGGAFRTGVAGAERDARL